MNKAKEISESFLESAPAQDLFTAISALSSPEEARDFLRDLCTLSEIYAMAERWQIVLELSKGTPYREIAEKLKTSTATVSRVAHWMRNGRGGYRKMLEILKKRKS